MWAGDLAQECNSCPRSPGIETQQESPTAAAGESDGEDGMGQYVAGEDRDSVLNA